MIFNTQLNASIGADVVVDFDPLQVFNIYEMIICSIISRVALCLI